MIGVVHVGFTVFPMSVRNSAAATAHLVRKTGVVQLYVSPDAPAQRLAAQVAEIFKTEGYALTLVALPQFSELYDEKNTNLWTEQPEQVHVDSPVVILHSSGGYGIFTSFHLSPQPQALPHSPSRSP